MPELHERVAVLMLHAGCNMHCDFCISDNRISEMSFAQGVEALGRLRARGFGNVVFGGGEPFVWRHGVAELAARAKALGFLTQIGTNGVALPPYFERLECFDRYVLPLDAADAKTHNDLRHYRGEHYQIIAGRLELLREVGRPVTISTVVTSRNAETLALLADYLEGYVRRGGQLHAWHLYKFLPYGRGGARHAETLDLSLAAYHAACDIVRSRALPFRVYKRPDMRHSRNVDFFWHEGDSFMAGSESWSTRAPEPGEAASAMGWPCETCASATPA